MRSFNFTRRWLCATLAVLVTLPATAAAHVSHWEFFEPPLREYSRLRKVPDTMAIEFAGQRIDPKKAWADLSDAERQAVHQAQGETLAAGEDPPCPVMGLKPMIERLHRVRGPANAPLRVHVSVDAVGQVSRLATDLPLDRDFLNELLGLLINSAYRPAVCGGKACAKRLTLDLVYLGA
jgi:hypothetical protein